VTDDDRLLECVGCSGCCGPRCQRPRAATAARGTDSMGDAGDYWRTARKARWRASLSWTECVCGRRVPPGEPCFGCGRVDGSIP
jgi:hypothetical protein